MESDAKAIEAIGLNMGIFDQNPEM